MSSVEHPLAAGSPAAHADLDPEADGLILASRQRVVGRLADRDRSATALLAGGFLAAGVAASVLLESARSPSALVVLGLAAAYVFALRIEFEIGTGSAIPTQVVLVPMLFLLPVGGVPLVVAAGVSWPGTSLDSRDGIHLDRVLLRLVNSWHAIGPALVLGLAGEAAPSWDMACGSTRSHWARSGLRLRGVRDARLARARRLAALVAALLEERAPGRRGAGAGGLAGRLRRGLDALGVSRAAAPARAARRLRAGAQARIDHALELSSAYRGTALLLGDVVEADDAYTGSHSRDVVDLVLDVCDELGVDARSRRDAEFAALLHDVGKIRIPSEIINKPGKLDAEERAIIETHTVIGEQLLKKVGGLLGDVGRDRPLVPRALGRRGLSGRAGRRVDPARGADRVHLRRVLAR